MNDAEHALALLTGKVTILEGAVAVLVMNHLVHHPDPLDGLATLERILDRQVAELVKPLSSELGQKMEAAAQSTVSVLIQAGQQGLDEAQADAAKRRS